MHAQQAPAHVNPFAQLMGELPPQRQEWTGPVVRHVEPMRLSDMNSLDDLFIAVFESEEE